MMKTAAVLIAAALSADAAEPPVIHDAKLISAFEKGVGAFADQGGFPDAEALEKSLSEAPRVAPADTRILSAPASQPVDAVFLVGSVYKCGRCEHWHPGGVATAWAIGTDGLMISNHHVFANAEGAAMGICDRHGNTYPVTHILAANPAADVALFRVKADKLPTLALGEAAAIGDDVEVISHPQRQFFFHTFGKVARYSAQPARDDQPETVWMNITADFAKGSSGGPAISASGEVVGMVASTQSIYYESEDGSPKGPLQMVIKNCVPATAIRQLLGSSANAETSEPRKIQR